MKKLAYLFSLLALAPAAGAFDYYEHPLKQEIKQARFDEVSRVLESNDFEQSDIDAIFEAMFEQCGKKITPENFDQAYHCIEILLNKGANANAELCDETPIFYAIQHLWHTYKIKQARLYKAWEMHSEPFSMSDPLGPDIIADCPERTKIILQTCNLIELLVQYGADPNVGEYDSIRSPLDFACFTADAPEVVACLLKRGATASINNFCDLHVGEIPASVEKLCERYFNTCSYLCEVVTIKVQEIEKFVEALKAIDTNDFSTKKVRKIKKTIKAFQVRLARLKTTETALLAAPGIERMPAEIASYILPSIRSFIGCVLWELCDDIGLEDELDYIYDTPMYDMD